MSLFHFVGEPIEAVFDETPPIQKKPPCPGAFLWRGERFTILGIESEWQDFRRRGKMAHNMREEHLATAQLRGSWGVGRHYFRVRTDRDRTFDIYYDRAPKGTRERKGGWYIFREMHPGAA